MVSRVFCAAVIFVLSALAQVPTNPASIGGRVIDTNGNPIRKAGLILRVIGQPGPPATYNAISDADGRYFFEGVTPDGYTLSVERAGYLARSYRASPRETFSTILLNAGQRLDGIDVKLPRALTISGRVLDDAGDPVASVPVRLLQLALQPGFGLKALRTVYTDESGNYHLTDLTAGQYYVGAGPGTGAAFPILGMRAIHGGASDVPLRGDPREYFADTFYPGEIDARSAKAIDVLSDDIERLDVRLRKTAGVQVRGKLVGAVSGPMEECQVALTPPDLPSVMSPTPQGTVARVGKDGSFGFSGARFAPGEYFLTVIRTQRGQAVLARQRLVIGTRDIDDVVINVEPLVELRGRVTLEGGQLTPPAPPVTMQVGLAPVDSPVSVNLRGRIEAGDGSFSVTGVAPGLYDVKVSGMPGSEWLKSMRLGSQEFTDGRIEVTGASGRLPLQVTLSRAMGQIEGVVAREPGKPAVSSSVTLFAEPIGRGVSILTGVQENGRFTLQVAPGTYRLYAWEDLEMAQRYDAVLLKGQESMSVTVTVRAGGTERVMLREIPAAEQ